MNSLRETTKNDDAWGKLFDKYDIINHVEKNGQFIITSTQINEFREARLMTKFDHRINLPKLFSKNKLSILPISRGSYIISNFDAYKDFEALNHKIFKVSFPEHIESIDYKNITSEAMAINCAYISNIFSDFTEDYNLLPTVSGRMSSNAFSFNIKNISTNTKFRIDVLNSQIEVDGGFEGIESLCLVEAKNFISDDFIIRQLYYPFRLWQNNITKKVRTIFLVYSNGIFSLYEYEFQDPFNYNSLVLIKQKNYSIESVNITFDEILNVLNRVKTIEEPKIPFPQADSFKRVINLCELLAEGEKSRDEITLNYAFDPRQTNYYTDAGRYLGLIDKKIENKKPIYLLSNEGHKILNLTYKSRQLKFVELILKHEVFVKVFKKYLENEKMPSKSEIVEIMKKSNLYNIDAESTYERRASTVSGWINWILELQR